MVGLVRQPRGIQAIWRRHHFPAEPSHQRRRVAVTGVVGPFTGQYSCQTTDLESTTKRQGFPQPPTEGRLDAVPSLQRTTCLLFPAQDMLQVRLRQNNLPHTVVYDQPYVCMCNLPGGNHGLSFVAAVRANLAGRRGASQPRKSTM